MDKRDNTTAIEQDREHERLARTWDATYRIYVKYPNEQHYQIMCNAYDDLTEYVKRGVQNG